MKKITAILTTLALIIGVLLSLNSSKIASAEISPVNLINNPSFENSNTTNTLPLNWQKGGFGTSTFSFTYPVEGYEGQKAAKLAITKYTSGDRKWFFDDVAVKPNTKYTLVNYYKSNIKSEIDVRYTLTNNKQTYIDLLRLGTSLGEWKKAEVTFTHLS